MGRPSQAPHQITASRKNAWDELKGVANSNNGKHTKTNIVSKTKIFFIKYCALHLQNAPIITKTLNYKKLRGRAILSPLLKN